MKTRLRSGLMVAAAAAAALAATGCSHAAPARKRPPAGGGPPRVTLRLLAPGPARTLTACGVRTRYPSYRFGGFVRYSGAVSPPPAGRWSVKVKLKRCVPHGYSESFFEIVRGRSDGSFGGLVPKLNPNEFYVRAEYRPAGAALLSMPAYFRVVGHG